MGQRYGSSLDLPALAAAPAAPPTGSVAVYAKAADGLVYGLDSLGVEMLLSNPAGLPPLAVLDGAGVVLEANTRTLIFSGAGVDVTTGALGEAVIHVPGYALDQPLARLVKTSSQSVPNNTRTRVEFQKVSYAVPETFADVANNRLTIPVDGTYNVVAYAQWGGVGAAGNRVINVDINGAEYREQRVSVTGAQRAMVSAYFCKKFTAGTHVQASCRLSGGSAGLLEVGPELTNPATIEGTCLEAIFVGPA